MKLFYTGPVINTEMLVVMLEKHGINATHLVLAGESTDEEDLNRIAQVSTNAGDVRNVVALLPGTGPQRNEVIERCFACALHPEKPLQLSASCF